MANLSAAEILKAGREYRAEVIVRKLTAGETFELSNGKFVSFKKSVQVIALLQKTTKTSSELNNIVFVGSDGNNYKLSDIKKNNEFGGKGDRSTVAKEDAALSSLNTQINVVKKQLKNAFVPIKVGTKTFKVMMAESTPGTPKSDFHLVDIDGNECVWISHKDGKTAKDFQQWGGISERKEPLIFNHKETKKFIADLKAVYPNGLPPATTLYRYIKDNTLKMYAVYGNKFGNGNPLGQQNVSILLQGPITLIKKNNAYVLTANHVHYNGDSVDGDGFDPVLMAIYKGDRSDAGVTGTRIVISPVGGRKGELF
jgi:hypothetical protein